MRCEKWNYMIIARVSWHEHWGVMGGVYCLWYIWNRQILFKMSYYRLSIFMVTFKVVNRLLVNLVEAFIGSWLHVCLTISWNWQRPSQCTDVCLLRLMWFCYNERNRKHLGLHVRTARTCRSDLCLCVYVCNVPTFKGTWQKQNNTSLLNIEVLNIHVSVLMHI